MQSLDSIGHVLKQYTERRFQQFSTTRLRDLSAPSDAFCTVPISYLEFLAQNAQPVCEWLDDYLTNKNIRRFEDTVLLFSNNMIRFIHSKNQFVSISEDEKYNLMQLYQEFLIDFRNVLDTQPGLFRLEDKLSQVLASHQADLELFVRNLAPATHEFVLKESVCSEYSPELQLEILHTQIDRLADPILDLGCGTQGRLVRYLNDHGKTAFGVDRDAGDDLIQADWLHYPLRANHWSTIISHMALSIHFLHHHLNPLGQPEQYARLYMSILHALKAGGQFFYAPGLPFIEDLLPPQQYRVERYPIPEVTSHPIEKVLRTQHKASISYASKITKYA